MHIADASSPWQKKKRKLNRFYKLYIKRDPFARAYRQWLIDGGDNALRFDYPLKADSIVFDVGGYTGDFASSIHTRYNATVYSFEPVKSFHQQCVDRFKGNEQIKCLPYGLSNRDQDTAIQLDADASSTNRTRANTADEMIELKDIATVVSALDYPTIDLMKINIEGGEYDILPRLHKAGLLSRFKYIQVQFHDFIPDAVKKRDAIRAMLGQSHTQQWCYPFVWESWQRQQDGYS